MTLSNVAAAMNTSFASPKWRSREFDEKCLISTHMKDEMEKLGREMDGVLYSFLDSITIHDIEKDIMTRYRSGGDGGGSYEKDGHGKGATSGTE